MSFLEERSGQQMPAWIWGVMALCSLTFLIYRAFRARPKIHALLQGEAGERAVGQYLEKLRTEGYEVFHDLIGEGFNVDHAIIGPAGVFTIETKTWSKPAKGETKIHFDGQSLTLPGQAANRRPIIQAQAQAGWLQTLLHESTGREVKVRPVVLFPGWFVDNKQARQSSVWVLNPKALPKFLAHQSQKLSPEDIQLFSFHLSRWIRSEESRSF